MKQIKPLMQLKKPTHRQFTDIEGEKFGRLVVISYAGGRKYTNGRAIHYWNCKCECGAKCVIGHHNLRTGITKSCGCYQVDNLTTRNANRSIANRRIALEEQQIQLERENNQLKRELGLTP